MVREYITFEIATFTKALSKRVTNMATALKPMAMAGPPERENGTQVNL